MSSKNHQDIMQENQLVEWKNMVKGREHQAQI